MDQSSKKLAGFAAVIFASLILVTACNTFPALRKPTTTPMPTHTDTTPHIFTVDEVWEKAKELDGQHIVMRGYTNLMIGSTLQKCTPDFCDCNKSELGALYLTSAEDVGTKLWDAPNVSILSKLSCNGNQCEVTCAPFDPNHQAFEFSGTVQVRWNSDEIDDIYLKDIDLDQSLEMTSEKVWRPIQTGEFTFPIRQQAP